MATRNKAHKSPGIQVVTVPVYADEGFCDPPGLAERERDCLAEAARLLKRALDAIRPASMGKPSGELAVDLRAAAAAAAVASAELRELAGWYASAQAREDALMAKVVP